MLLLRHEITKSRKLRFKEAEFFLRDFVLSSFRDSFGLSGYRSICRIAAQRNGNPFRSSNECDSVRFDAEVFRELGQHFRRRKEGQAGGKSRKWQAESREQEGGQVETGEEVDARK